MKLTTDIAPRRDGTVIVPGAGKQKFVFEENEAGELTCDVEDEASLKVLLANDHIFPFNDEDIAAALALTPAGGTDVSDDGADGDLDDEEDDEVDDDFIDGDDPLGDDASGGALPEEANTPPAASSARKRASKAPAEGGAAKPVRKRAAK